MPTILCARMKPYWNTAHQGIKLKEEANEIANADKVLIDRYFSYRSSGGIAINMLFTMAAMRQEKETLDFIESFDRRLFQNGTVRPMHI